MSTFIGDTRELSSQAEGRQAIEAIGTVSAKGAKVESNRDMESRECALWNSVQCREGS